MQKPFNIFYFFIIVAFLLSNNSFGQNGIASDKEWKDILTEYESGKIADTTYFRKVKKLAIYSFTDSSLKEKLEPYRKIAWSKKAYHLYRLDYYIFLSNNATLTYKAGQSIYYAEKFDEEMKKEKPYMSSFLSTRLMFFIYGRNKSGNNRCTAEFNRILPILKMLPQRILTDSVPRSTCTNAMVVLSNQAGIYQENKDSINLRTISDLTENMYNSIIQKSNQYKASLTECLYALYLTKYYEKKLKGTPSEINEILRKTNALIASSKNPIWQKAAESDISLKFMNFFIDQKQNDSAEHYLQLIKAQQGNSIAEFSDGTVYLLNNGKLKATEGDYKAAYENVLRAYEINDSVIGVKTADITNNMYAQSVAEQNAEELKKAEAEKQQRNKVFGIIAVLSIISILFLYLQMRRKEKDAKSRIDKLNFASQLQIMELEEKSRFIKQEEQKKLGMDLHDNLAGTIAAIKTKVESELINNPDKDQTERLKTISSLVTKVYETTRNKSHELYHGWDDESEISFSKRIKLITDNAFESNKFKTEIAVDDNSLTNASVEIKIELLHIIQEAITNIIKHAGANKISILIYEDIGGLVLHISDNGKGFNPKLNNKGIGLSSIKERAIIVNGDVDIKSGPVGTEINVTIPMSA